MQGGFRPQVSRPRQAPRQATRAQKTLSEDAQHRSAYSIQDLFFNPKGLAAGKARLLQTRVFQRLIMEDVKHVRATLMMATGFMVPCHVFMNPKTGKLYLSSKRVVENFLSYVLGRTNRNLFRRIASYIVNFYRRIQQSKVARYSKAFLDKSAVFIVRSLVFSQLTYMINTNKTSFFGVDAWNALVGKRTSKSDTTWNPYVPPQSHIWKDAPRDAEPFFQNQDSEPKKDDAGYATRALSTTTRWGGAIRGFMSRSLAFLLQSYSGPLWQPLLCLLVTMGLYMSSGKLVEGLESFAAGSSAKLAKAFGIDERKQQQVKSIETLIGREKVLRGGKMPPTAVLHAKNVTDARKMAAEKELNALFLFRPSGTARESTREILVSHLNYTSQRGSSVILSLSR